jgi:DNA-directed RNA polymerase II subunit RPB1
MENVHHTLSQGPQQRVTRVQFGLLDADTIERLSVCAVDQAVLYSRGTPSPGGCMDPRLGTTDRRMPCATCGNDVRTCCGHIGRIDLPVACFNVGYLEHTRKILQCVCISCQRICWDPGDDRVQTIINSRRGRGKDRLGAVYKACRPRSTCARCGGPRGIVQRVALTYRIDYNETALNNLDSEERAFYTQPLYAELVRSVFQFIPPDEQVHLGFKTEHARPVDLIITRLVVPPAIIRPAISASEGSRARGQDDLTVKLQEINKRCIEIRNHMRGHNWDRHSMPLEAVDRVARLQFDVATLVANIRGMRPSAMRSGIPLQSVTDRLKGKEGRFRANLMGKRVDQSARSVISPDPTLDVDEVGVPTAIALTLTITDRVTVHNLKKMRDRVVAGAGVLEGAEAVTLRDGKCIQLAVYNVHNELSTLEIVPGCMVERYLQNGDRVVFNRQPSLHKMGMMAHRVRVMKGDTFRLNLSCTTPYNADFDGDEMNLHVPQSLAAMAETMEVMGVSKQIVAPQANKPCIGLVQDTLLGTYLLTSPDIFLNKGDAMQLLMQLKYPAEPDLLKMLPPPTILRPRELWTGVQMFSLLFPTGLCMGAPLKELKPLGQAPVRVQNGQIIHGRLSKQHVGTSGGGIVHLLYLDFDDQTACRFLSEAQRLVNFWLQGRGFSIGIKDCMRPEAAKREVEEYVQLANHHVDSITEAAAAAGNAASTHEVEDAIQDILTKVLGAAGGIVGQHVAGSCLAQTIAAGSKGNPVNIAQIAGCVGQQCVEGRRIDPPAPSNRSLPCFDPNDLSGASRGFVATPYVDGLSPDETFFHAMGGREGLVDTAVKTARTGYIQRRLIKGMESLGVSADGSVRNAGNLVVEFVYGSDGWDATWVERQVCRGLEISDAQLREQCLPEELQGIVNARDRVRRGMLGGPSGTLAPHVFVPVPAGRLIEQCPKGDYDEDDAVPDDLKPENFALATWMECRQLCCTGRGAAGLELVLLYEWRAANVAPLTLAARSYLRHEALRRTARARVSQGEMVGCIAAQSIGEPTTQVRR